MLSVWDIFFRGVLKSIEDKEGKKKKSPDSHKKKKAKNSNYTNLQVIQRLWSEVDFTETLHFVWLFLAPYKHL